MSFKKRLSVKNSNPETLVDSEKDFTHLCANCAHVLYLDGSCLAPVPIWLSELLESSGIKERRVSGGRCEAFKPA